MSGVTMRSPSTGREGTLAGATSSAPGLQRTFLEKEQHRTKRSIRVYIHNSKSVAVTTRRRPFLFDFEELRLASTAEARFPSAVKRLGKTLKASLKRDVNTSAAAPWKLNLIPF